jgi:uncharacterized protein (DUF1501 family)
MITRRTLFESSGMLALGTAVWPRWMPRMAFRQEDTPPTGDILIVVFARGGYDGLNMVIPFGDGGNYFNRRRNIAIPAPDSSATRKGVDLDGFFGMHPTLALPSEGRWKQWYDEGILAMVHAVAMSNDTRSHFDAMDFMERGTPGQKSRTEGWLGKHLATVASANGSPFRAVGLGTQLQASLRGPVPAVALQSIAEFHLQGRQTEIARFQQHLQTLYGGEGWLDSQGQATFAALDMLKQSVAPGTYVPGNGAVYEQNGFAMGLAQVAQLIKADVGLEVACVDIGGWDTHANQVDAADPTQGGMSNQMRQLSRGISAFITDMRERFDPRSAEQGVTIVVMSEFGRRAGENGGLGTDHGHGNVMFTFGKGINGGKVYGRWPGLADDKLDRGDLARTTEYRDVLGEILSKRAGNEAVSEVFPNHAFSFLGIARKDGTTVPPTATAEPTATTRPPDPTATPVVDPYPAKVYIPLAGNGG